MAKYIECETFLEQERKRYCEDCSRRQGIKNGKFKTLYEIGEAPCRACEIYDVMNDVEDFPAADVRPVVRGHWIGTKEAEDMGDIMKEFTCSVCGCCEWDCTESESFNFCPNCGADMREGE